MYNLSNDMERRGVDLYSGVTVSVYDILLGCSLTVATLRGPRQLTIPPGGLVAWVGCLAGENGVGWVGEQSFSRWITCLNAL